MAAKRALITGITGQDGSYLAEFLLEQGYEVVGMVRRTSTLNFQRIEQIQDRLTLLSGDLADQISLLRLLDEVRPHEVYNLAAQSFVPTSWQQPVLTGDVSGLGVTRLLDAVRQVDPTIRVYQASSREMFGKVQEVPQRDDALLPAQPVWRRQAVRPLITVNYRESYGLFACSCICFNHESPRRGQEFVTKKIARAAARICRGLESELRLGSLEARRDWGYAPDYVRGMWLMLQQEQPADYVLATGETHSVEEFAAAAFAKVGLDWRDYVVQDPRLVRPAK